MSGFINTGPGEDGKVLIEEDADGKLIRASGTVGVKTTEDGGIKNLGISLGDDVYFKAVDADGNAKELTATFHYDEEKGQFYLKTVFKGGDQTEIKVFPFKFTSEKVGEDAVAALSVQIEKQNMQHYLRTMTNILDMEKINDYLSIGGAGQMQVRVGGDRGMEFYFANDNWGVADGSNPHLGGPMDDGVALGLGFFNRGGDKSTTHSGGILISSDSSLRYEVEAGTLSFAGMDLPDTGRIPLTIGTYYKYENDNGTAVFGTLGTSLADLGSVSSGVVVRKKIGEDKSISYGAAVNTRGDYSVMAQFEWKRPMQGTLSSARRPR